MNGWEFVASLASSLAWPIVIVVMMILFKEQLKSLLGNIAGRIPTVSEITGPGNIALKFEQELKGVKDDLPPEAHQASTSDDNEDPSVHDPGAASFLAKIDALAEISPRAAVLEAYLRVETAAAKVVAQYAPQVRRSTIARMLKSVEAVPQYLVDAAEGLGRLRAEAAHAEEFVLPVQTVREYAATALDVSRGLDEILARAS